jgi:dTDP-4-amino-4,6-dideoxygalactose transaminase
MRIKFLDLSAQNREIAERVQAEMETVHANTAYIGGPPVAAFERDFANYLGVDHVVGVSSGTDALRLSLMALGIKPGDGVITVPMTFIATAAAIVQVGATPEFVDVDPGTCNLSVKALHDYLKAGKFRSINGPRAILPVDLYGLPCDLAGIKEVAHEFGLPVLEDSCQAHGARLKLNDKWVRAGTQAALGCFSFYPGKNLGAWGEGGAVATNDAAFAAMVAKLRDHGRVSHYHHDMFGYNARLDTLQAVVLGAKLTRLDSWNARRRAIAKSYRELLANLDLQFQLEADGYESCYHLFTIRHASRDAIRTALTAAEIDSGIHYPVPLHLQPACSALGYKTGDFPVSESIGDTTLSLPMHPHLTDDEVIRVSQIVRSAIA